LLTLAFIDSLSDEKMDDYYKNLLSSGETIHKATEKLCVDELKQSVGELLKYIHFCMHEYIILEEDLENALSDLTLESREKLKTTVKKAADARQSLISETPDVLLNVAVDSYRKDFRELISPLPRLREKCCKFLNELKEESAVFRQRNTILRSRCLRYKCETAPTNAPTLAMWIPTGKIMALNLNNILNLQLTFSI